MPNNLDTAVRALREQLRIIDSETRQLSTARTRVERALVVLNADPVKGTRNGHGRTPWRSNPEMQVQSESAVAVRDLIEARFYDRTFTSQDIGEHLAYERSTISLALKNLTITGYLARTGRARRGQAGNRPHTYRRRSLSETVAVPAAAAAPDHMIDA